MDNIAFWVNIIAAVLFFSFFFFSLLFLTDQIH